MIEEMTQGKWKVSIIKHYTVGVQTGSSEQPRKTLGIVGDIVKSGLTLEEVKLGIEVNRIVEANGTTLDEMAELTANASNSKLGIAGFVSVATEAKNYGIPMEELSQTQN